MQDIHPEIFYWLATTRLDGVGASRMRQWIEALGDIKQVFTATESQLRSIGCKPCDIATLHNVDWRMVEQDFAWCEHVNCHLITFQDARYPKLLSEIYHAPLLLFVRGDTSLLMHPQIAMVGSRNPTKLGCETAERFARCIAEAGVVVTSGMALGIDAASHRGALAVKGKTIAVMGTGLRNFYPASHYQLAEDIIAQGAVVSEFSPATGPHAQNFPMRNRIISGMSMGVLVIEAARQSGSLITAQYAIEQNREVFAIPGSIHNPMARGCHQLIQQGAKLIETTHDILTELGVLHAVVEENRLLCLETESQMLLNCIDHGVTTMDVIKQRYNGAFNQLPSLLIELECAGYISSVVGGYMRNR